MSLETMERMLSAQIQAQNVKSALATMIKQVESGQELSLAAMIFARECEAIFGMYWEKGEEE